MADELSGLERRLVERARDESRGWTNADYDLVLSAADALGECRRLVEAMGEVPGSALKVRLAYLAALAKLEGGDRGIDATAS